MTGFGATFLIQLLRDGEVYLAEMDVSVIGMVMVGPGVWMKGDHRNEPFAILSDKSACRLFLHRFIRRSNFIHSRFL